MTTRFSRIYRRSNDCLIRQVALYNPIVTIVFSKTFQNLIYGNGLVCKSQLYI